MDLPKTPRQNVEDLVFITNTIFRSAKPDEDVGRKHCGLLNRLESLYINQEDILNGSYMDVAREIRRRHLPLFKILKFYNQEKEFERRGEQRVYEIIFFNDDGCLNYGLICKKPYELRIKT